MIASRRGFLTGMLALGVAPAIVRASSLMAVRPVEWYGRSPGLDVLGNRFEAYTSTFRFTPGIRAPDWRYVVRISSFGEAA